MVPSGDWSNHLGACVCFSDNGFELFESNLQPKRKLNANKSQWRRWRVKIHEESKPMNYNHVGYVSEWAPPRLKPGFMFVRRRKR